MIVVEHTAFWLIALVALVGYAFFLGHWTGRRESRRERALLYRQIRAIRRHASRSGRSASIWFGADR